MPSTTQPRHTFPANYRTSHRLPSLGTRLYPTSQISLDPSQRDIRDQCHPFDAGSPDTTSNHGPEIDDTIGLDVRTPHPPGRFLTPSHSGPRPPPVQESDAIDIHVVNEICATLETICLDDSESLQKVESAALTLSTLQAHDGLDFTVNAILDGLSLKDQDVIIQQATGQVVSIIRRASSSRARRSQLGLRRSISQAPPTLSGVPQAPRPRRTERTPSPLSTPSQAPSTPVSNSGGVHFATHQTETLNPSIVPVPTAGTGDREGLVVGLDPPHASDGPSRRLLPINSSQSFQLQAGSLQERMPSRQPATKQEAGGSTFPAVEHPADPPQLHHETLNWVPPTVPPTTQPAPLLVALPGESQTEPSSSLPTAGAPTSPTIGPSLPRCQIPVRPRPSQALSRASSSAPSGASPSGDGLSPDGIPYMWTAFGIRNRLGHYAVIFRSSSGSRLLPPTLTSLNSTGWVSIGDLWLHSISPSKESPDGSFQLWIYDYSGGDRHGQSEAWMNLEPRIAAERFPIAYPGNHNLDGGLRYKLSFRLNGDVNWIKWGSKQGVPRVVYEGD